MGNSAASRLFGQEHFCLWLFEPYLWDIFVLKISETDNYVAFLSISLQAKGYTQHTRMINRLSFYSEGL